jgi:hypothetical protein
VFWRCFETPEIALSRTPRRYRARAFEPVDSSHDAAAMRPSAAQTEVDFEARTTSRNGFEPNAEISIRKGVIGKMKSTNNVLTLSDAELTNFKTQIEHMATILSEGFEPMEPKQVQRLVKLSGRRLKAVPEITKLAGTFGLSSPSAPVADISANLASATKLRMILASVDALRDVLAGHALATEAYAWKGASTLYGVLQGEAKGNPVLKKALSPVRDQLKNNRKGATQETATAGTAAQTTSTTNATTTAKAAVAQATPTTVSATTAG